MNEDRTILAAKTVSELKRIARENGHRGTAVDFMTKDQIIDLLVKPAQSIGDFLPEAESERPIAEAPAQEPVAATSSQNADFLGMLATALKPMLANTVNETQVRSIIEEQLKKSAEQFDGHILKLEQYVTVMQDIATELLTVKPVTVELKLPDGTVTNTGMQHRKFEDLLKLCAVNLSGGRKINVWVSGPAGTGKTTAAERVAEALKLSFHFNGAIDSEYKLRGFVDAQGRIVSTAFRQAYENGGIYLFDEVDSSLPPALLAFNAALANDHYDFPDGMVKRHPSFVCIAAANTYGLGADAEYVGRLKQDAAFLDRFVFLDWPIDEALERHLAQNNAWVDYVQEIRRKAQEHGIKVVISPRASLFGSTLLASGFDRDQVIRMTVRKGIKDDQWRTIAA